MLVLQQFTCNMVYYSEGMLDRAKDHIERYGSTHKSLTPLYNLLTKVVRRRGGMTYIDSVCVPVAHRSKIFGKYKEHSVRFGTELSMNGELSVNHISIDERWHDLSQNSDMADDFVFALAEISFMDHAGFLLTKDNVEFDYVVNGEHCYIVNLSNWKYVAAMVYRCIHEITCK